MGRPFFFCAALLCACSVGTDARAAGAPARPQTGLGAALAHRAPGTIRIATYNASLNRSQPGQLVADLSTPGNAQARVIAEVIQRVAPDVLLINEFDYDPAQAAAKLFARNYLEVSQGGAPAQHYRWHYTAAVNTGVPSGLDLDHDGRVAGGGDALGFGLFPGQYGMVVYSRLPIDAARVRTFREFLWKDMPDAALPPGWYPPEAQAALRLSSKSHWDLPLRLPRGRPLHLLVSHPTPPAFDGPEDRNGRRNHDEIRFWADYLEPARAGYITDDRGGRGGLDPSASFIIAGDQNADPLDGDHFDGAIRQLLEHPRVNAGGAPASAGAVEAAVRQGGNNATQRGDARFDTADFGDRGASPGNLRADYVLPSKDIDICASGVFWPTSDDPLARLVNDDVGASSDHRLVWIDVAMAGGCRRSGGAQ